MSTRSSIAALSLPALCLQAGALSAFALPAFAAPKPMAPHRAVVSPQIRVGSDNIAVIEPRIKVPAETPCTVTLYSNAQFGANNVDYTYTPPAKCPGPWAKVVLAIDTSLDKGIQYDRTGTLWLGGVPLWFGTTSEPTPNLAPKWHIERDVTDYTALLKTAQSGFVLIANYTNQQDTSIITTSAKLLFYPATNTYPAPRTPDQVIAFAQPGGGTAGLGTPTDTLTITPTLPTNIVAASLDLYLQGQSGDEFWYTCVPNVLSGPLESCGGGSFREGEVSIDSTPAGVAPVFPWIFTGGIDPYLWLPIPGVQTLNFKPFRVELSPFAGVLSNGQPHSISLSVAGANNYFSVAGAMFLYTDPNTPTVTGAVTTNTLKPANPIVYNGTTTNNGTTSGHLNTNSHHDFTISGYAVTSSGKVTSSVHQTSTFKNDQNFDITDSLYKQIIAQATNTTVATRTTGAPGNSSLAHYNYPLSVKLVETIAPSGGGTQKTTINQQYLTDHLLEQAGQPADQSTLADAIDVTDTLSFDSNFNITGHKHQASTASYIATGKDGCFERQLTATSNKLRTIQNGCK